MKIIPCIIGLGYVGLPITLNLAKKFFTYGFDINRERIKNLKYVWPQKMKFITLEF